jgi:hypothetical protein
MFGHVKTFKTTNPMLPNAKKEIETLYWKIYGTWHITNKLMIWFVKGWIAK